MAITHSVSSRNVGRSLATGALAATVVFGVSSLASARTPADQLQSSAHLSTASVSALPRSIAALVPVLEQHSRRGGSGGSGASGSGGGQAVPRGGSGGGGSTGGQTSGGSSSGGSGDGSARRRSGSGTDSTGGATGSTGTTTYSRPRDGRTQSGTAVERGDGQRGGRTTVIVPGGYYGGLYPWGWGGFGLGGYYGYYDPWMWGDPYPSSAYYDHDGSLKLKVSPRQAEVYVDGYFAGSVDDYDGVFQQLRINPGPHRIEVRLDGYETLTFDVRIEPGRTITYKGDLRQLGDDEDRDDDRDDDRGADN